MTVRDALAEAERRLAAAGIDTPRVDAEWLLAGALGIARSRLHAAPDRPMTGETIERYDAWIGRRARREPLQHILGTQAFRDITLRVGADVLVPRPETELLVAWALELLPAPGARPPLVVDVGTGSGCIACALAVERPDLAVVALEASPAAAALARSNGATLGISERVTVVVSDLFSALAPRRADLIVSNPPYLRRDVIATLASEVKDHEPRLALDGGPDGLSVIRRLVAEAPAWLVRGAPLVLEIGGDDQVAAVMTLMRDVGFTDVTSRRDLAGITRFVAGRRSREGL